MKNKYFFYLPIILSFFLIIGMYIGKTYFTNTIENIDFDNFIVPSNKSLNKIEALLYYIKKQYVDSVNEDSLIEKTIQSMLKNLDPHSVYIPASQMREMTEPLEGEFEGIGIEFSIQNDTIVVMQTIAGGPSEKAGLRVGDRIVKVNDSLVANVGIDNSKVLKLLKGPKGTKVKLDIKRNNVPNLLKFTIIRDVIPLHSIDVAIKVKDNIGYIKISRFAKTTPEEFRESLKKLHSQNVNKLIIDVRGNGGGYMDAAIEIADEFLKEGDIIVYTEGREQPRKVYKATNEGIAHNDDIVILQDEWSASASEILAGAIQDNDRGIIIGKRSFGKGLVQEPIFFNDGSTVRLTVARYFTPSGRCIQRKYNNSVIKYYTDLLMRNDSVDSADIKNAPKYKTKKGRIVYGNGGIYPDIVIKSNEKYNDFFYKVASQSIIYQFAFQVSDKNRTVFKKFRNWKELDTYLQNSDLYEKFVDYAKKQNINPNEKDIINSKDLIMNHLRAYIVRNIFNDEGFYIVSLENDLYYKAAIEYFQKKNRPYNS